MSYRILLAEDEENIRHAVKLNLEMEGYEVSEASGGKSAWDLFKAAHFDLIILDVMMPDMDGYTLCQKIRLENSRVPVLFLTAKGSSEDRVQGLKLGADDYLAKPFNLEELLLRVKGLVRRGGGAEGPIAASTVKIGGCDVNFQTYDVKGVGGKAYELSKREMQLLKLLVDRKGEVVSREDILRTVWEYDVYPSTRTIDNYIVNFRKYFEKDPRSPKHFHSVRGVGYKFTE